MMNRTRQILAQIKYMLPGLLIRTDERLLQDLARWKRIHNLKCSDRNAMAFLLFQFKEFRNLLLYRQREYPVPFLSRRSQIEQFHRIRHHASL